MALHGPSFCLCPRGQNPKKLMDFFKILHERGIRSTKKADLLPFGYSFERRIDLEGSGYGPGAPFLVKPRVGAGPLQCPKNGSVQGHSGAAES